MKTQRIVCLLLLSGLPLTSQAHDSLEAMQQGGSLMKLTAALLHPLLETQYWPFLLFGLLVVLGLYGAARLGRKLFGYAAYSRQLQPVRVVKRRNHR